MVRRGIDLTGGLHIQSDPLLGIVNPVGDLVPFVVLKKIARSLRRHGELILSSCIGAILAFRKGVSGCKPVILLGSSLLLEVK